MSWLYAVRSVAATLALSTSLAASAGTVYRITDLGDFAGGADFSQAFSINNAGQVVGESSGPNGLIAFRWGIDCGLVPLTMLDGGIESSAYAINKGGFAAGREQSPTGTQAVRWAGKDKPPRPVASLGDGSFDVATAINREGHLAGYSISRVGLRAFRWTAAEGTVNLGDLPTGNGRSLAWGMNDEGLVVGSSDVQSLRRMTDHAFLWGPSIGMQDLGTLRGPSADYYSEARDINNTRQVVGLSDAPSGGKHAFLWTEAGGMQDLGELAGGSGYSIAMSINDKGQVVGVSDSSTGFTAFLWTAAKGMQNLAELIDPKDPLKGVASLSAANGINDKGEIVGSATINGSTRAILLTPVASN